MGRGKGGLAKFLEETDRDRIKGTNRGVSFGREKDHFLLQDWSKGGKNGR